MVSQFNPYTNYSDEELLPEIGSGSTGAFNELYDRWSQNMFSYFFRMLWKNKELAEDQTQELFLKILKHARDFDKSKSFKTWIFSIANNMCKNEYRKEEVKQKHAPTVTNQQVASAEINIDLRKFQIAVSKHIAELNEEKRALFILRFQEHFTIPEISEILHIAEGTVKSRLFYLLKEMKKDLQEFKTLNIN